MSRRRVLVITIGLLLSLFLSSMEGTVVATAMPTIVGQLGGLNAYSWVFSAFMLASTTTVPIFGKLSDIFGRRPVYISALLIFLIGSLLCGLAQSMGALVAYRVIQGLGAGGLMPLVFTIIGDIFTLEQRAKMQGVFSGVWGVSAIAGPLLGGFLVDQISWHWVFWINLLPGVIAGILVWFAWIDKPRPAGSVRPAIDWAGAGLMTAAIVSLLLALLEFGTVLSWVLFVVTVLLVTALLWVERRASDPIVPLRLFQDRIFIVACIHGLMAGCALFGSSSFVPLYAQAVLGTSATGAGAVLAPQLLGWVGASIVVGRLILRFSCRSLVMLGTSLMLIGMLLLSQFPSDGSRLLLGFDLALTGVGMGLCIPAFLIVVQSTVARRDLGSATSTVQFSRQIGGTIGVSVMGAVLSAVLASHLLAAGLDPSLADQLLNTESSATVAPAVEGMMRGALASGVQGVFYVGLIAAVLALIATFFTPGGRVEQLMAARAHGD